MPGSISTWTAAVCGIVAVAAVPAAVAKSVEVGGVELVHAVEIATPVAVAFALVAVVAGRRARLALARTPFERRRRVVGAARLTAWAGLYVSVTSALALGVYGVLIWAQ